MQIGGSIGLSIFTALYAATAGSTDDLTGKPLLEAFTSGYSAAFLAAAVGMVLASAIATTLIRGTKSELLPQGDASVMVHAG